MSGILKVFGLDKVAKLPQIIKQHGGLKASLYHLYRTDDLKVRLSLSRRFLILFSFQTGRLVGEDKYGNKYYQNDEYFYGRNRWIIYDAKHGVDYDASMVPAEWFGWLHYKTDKTPVEKAPVNYAWMPEHQANTSGSSAGRCLFLCVFLANVTHLISGADTLMGSNNAYMPYSTTKPKIQSWVPPKN